MGDDRLFRSAISGIVAGLAAAWIMNRVQELWNSTSAAEASGLHPVEGEQVSTVKTASRLAESMTDSALPEKMQAPAGSAVHYAFGATLGGIYGVASLFFPQVRAGFGTAYGAAVALAADEFLVPAMGLAPKPREVPAGTHAYGMISHFVFGVALEGARRAIDARLEA